MKLTRVFLIGTGLLFLTVSCGDDDSGTTPPADDVGVDTIDHADGSDDVTLQPDAPQLDAAEDLPDDITHDVAVDVAVDTDQSDVTDDADQSDGGEDALPRTPMCTTNADCADGELCRKPLGGCALEGVCEGVPETCPPLSAPVCGCDMVEYNNACLAHESGVSVFSLTPCGGAAGCVYNTDCGAGQFCKKDHGCLESGSCAPIPTECDQVWDPVCGCDNENYPNVCYANMDGHNTSSSGECGIPGACVSNADCGASQYCSYNPNQCSGLGSCYEKLAPEDCTPGSMDHPVCGCDGQTYDRYCLLMQNGVAAWDSQAGCENLTTCNEHNDCSQGWICAKPLGQCDAAGVCQPPPESCAASQIWTPVCGCDGNSYSSYCVAQESGTSVASMGACEDDSCDSDSECAEGEYCARQEGACGDSGLCTAKPSDCDPGEAPVCGCDGQTYWNACTASSEGINIRQTGECPTTGECTSNLDCSDDQYCALHFGQCMGFGTCEPRPAMDTCFGGLPDFVCGCDGMTAENACDASSRGVNVAYAGECSPQCNSNAECRGGQYCARELGTCSGPGRCLDTPLTCPVDGDPVCGCDGNDYPSACHARAAGVTLYDTGACNSTCTDSTDCTEGQYCAKMLGGCEGTGFCEDLPGSCPERGVPACGCDGTMYDTECLANAAGTSAARYGSCPAGCVDGFDCEWNEICDKGVGQCAETGTCKPTDVAGSQCPDLYEPVCGCDGTTYMNVCEAQMARTPLASNGHCAGDEVCMYNSECADGMFCKKDACREMGACAAMPSDCPNVYEPVCSCDLTTFDSPCDAQAAGKNVTYAAACGVTNGCLSNADCAVEEYCQLVACEELGTCTMRTPDASCTGSTVDPVCGCDGQTYDNACWASNAGASVLSWDDACDVTATACTSNEDCIFTEYCWKETADCGGTGVCHDRPSYCLGELWDPVCGCDGQTYDNHCEAHYVGVNAATLSNCE